MTRLDRIRPEIKILERVLKNILKKFGHVERTLVDFVVGRVDQIERSQTIRERGRPRKIIREVIKNDL